MPEAMIFDNTDKMRLYSLSKAGKDGAHAEFGVYSGRSINLLVKARPHASFLHVDCNLSSSTATIFEALAPKIELGCVILFDEDLYSPNFEKRERKIFAESLSQTGLKADCLAVCGQRATCKIHWFFENTTRKPSNALLNE